MGYLNRLYMHASHRCSEAIFSMLEEKSNSSLLDCGCGNGDFTREIAKRIKGCVKVCGIEIVPEQVESARNNGIIIYQSDLNRELSLESESMNVVFSNQVIEHLHDTDRFISEIYRVLKLGGYAVIATENLSSWHNIFALILGWQPFSLSNISSLRSCVGNFLGLLRQKKDSGIPRAMQHMRIFSPLGLKEIFKIHGFKCEKLLGAGYYPLPTFFANIMAKIDVCHAAFLVLKLRKS